MRGRRRIGEVVDNILPAQSGGAGGGDFGLVRRLAHHVRRIISGVAVEAQFLAQHLERGEQEGLARIIFLVCLTQRRQPRPLRVIKIIARDSLFGQLGELRAAEHQPQDITRRNLGPRAKDHALRLPGRIL